MASGSCIVESVSADLGGSCFFAVFLMRVDAVFLKYVAPDQTSPGNGGKPVDKLRGSGLSACPAKVSGPLLKRQARQGNASVSAPAQ